MRAGEDGQVAAVADAADQRRRGGAFAARDIDVEGGAAVLFGAVIVDRAAEPGLGHGVEKGLFQRMMVGQPVDRDRAGPAAMVIGAGTVCFHRPEMRQHVVIAPACRAAGRPAVEILPVPAHEHHAVERGRPADDLAARLEDPPVVHIGLGLGREAPVARPAEEILPCRRRHPDRPVALAPAGLEKQDRNRRILAQPRGDHAAGRTAADNDVVVAHACSPVPNRQKRSTQGRSSISQAQALRCCAWNCM